MISFSAFDWLYDESTGFWWSMDCNFPGNPLANFHIPREQCAGVCMNDPRCYHFNWKHVESANVCSIKSDFVSKIDAVYLDGAVCGYFDKPPANATGTNETGVFKIRIKFDIYLFVLFCFIFVTPFIFLSLRVCCYMYNS
jgi:hypothetical protein